MAIPLPLYDYQENSVNALFSEIKRCLEPVMAELGTGAGKSFIVAGLAHRVHEFSGKRVLVLQPSKELVEQNYQKFLMTGRPASVFCAGLGSKCTRHDVIFASPLSIKAKIRAIAPKVGLIIIDECHGTTDAIKEIIEAVREVNPNVRVVGLTATPYRMLTGFIYKLDVDGTPVPEGQCIDPYYLKCVVRYDAEFLLSIGRLTPPRIGQPLAQSYDVSGLELGSNGLFTAKSLDRAFTGQGRLTSEIVADVVKQSANAKGVMLFAATIQHALEIMASLPPGLSVMVSSKKGVGMPRDEAIKGFKAMRYKYIVSVRTLTTGFDAPHVDVIALLCHTESRSLLQQIIGRGMRLFEGKYSFLLLDYADNLAKHAPDGRLFKPVIKVGGGESCGTMTAVCPLCNGENTFSVRKNDNGFEMDENGYYLDLNGEQIMTDTGPMPGHYGRRCQNMALVAGMYHQCSYRWTDKECPACGVSNDIAARYCCGCKEELVDPNKKLSLEFKRMKKDPTNIQTDIITEWKHVYTLSQKGERVLRVDVTTPYRKLSAWFHPDSQHHWLKGKYDKLMEVTHGLGLKPDTVTYRKDPKTGFYEIHDYNQPEDRL